MNPFSTAVPFWGRTIHISSSLSPKRDCGPKRVSSHQMKESVVTLSKVLEPYEEKYPKNPF